jgi:hypothetical protein
MWRSTSFPAAEWADSPRNLTSRRHSEWSRCVNSIDTFKTGSLVRSQPAESPQMCTELHGLRHQLVSQLTEHNWNIKQSNNRWIWWWTLYKKQVATSHYYLYIISPRPRPTHGQVAAQRNSVAPFGFACGVHPTTYRRDTPGHVDPKDSHRPSDRGTVVVRMDGSWGERQDGKLSYPLVPWFPIPLYILLIIYNYIYIYYDFWGLVVFRKCVFPPYLPTLPGLFYNCAFYKLSSPGATAEINLKLTFFRTAKINC